MEHLKKTTFTFTLYIAALTFDLHIKFLEDIRYIFCHNSTQWLRLLLCPCFTRFERLDLSDRREHGGMDASAPSTAHGQKWNILNKNRDSEEVLTERRPTRETGETE